MIAICKSTLSQLILGRELNKVGVIVLCLIWAHPLLLLQKRVVTIAALKELKTLGKEFSTQTYLILSHKYRIQTSHSRWLSEIFSSQGIGVQTPSK